MVLAQLAALGNGDVQKGAAKATAAVTSAMGGRAAEGYQSQKASVEEIAYVVGYVIGFLLVAFAAAKLSWDYNSYLGNTVGWKLLYAVLAFLFSEFYIPVYALFLNPVGTMSAGGANAGANVGGRRNNARRNNGAV